MRGGVIATRWFRSPGTATTWMGDCLQTGKPSRYLPNHLGQLSFLSVMGGLIEYQPVWLGLGGARSLVSAGR